MSKSITNQLPTGWELISIGEINLPIEKVIREYEDSTEEISYIDIDSIDNKHFVIKEPKVYSWQNAPSRARQIVKAGDILFSTVRPYLKNIAIVPKQSNRIIASTGFCIIRPYLAYNKYVFYYVIHQPFIDNINKLAKGTSYPAVTAKIVLEQTMPLPPILEQQRIVEKIEELFSKLDKSINALNLAKNQLKSYRHLLLTNAFQGKLTEEWRSQHKPKSAEKLLSKISQDFQDKYELHLAEWERQMKLWSDQGRSNPKPVKPKLNKKISSLNGKESNDLSKLPVGWVYTHVDELLEYGRDCAYGVVQPGPDTNNGVKLIRVGDINDGLISQDGLKKISASIANQYKRTFLKGGEVLISLVGAIGRTAVVPASLEGANIARAVGVMPISKLINPYYFELFFREPSKTKEMNLAAHEVARKTLNIEDVKKTTVILCSREEQDKIVDTISYQFSIIDSLDRTIIDSFNQLETLKQGILKKAFQGLLVEQKEDEEPAKEFSKRIRNEIDIFVAQQKRRTKPKLKKMISETKEMSIVEVLQSSKTPMTAKAVWQQSKHKNDIEGFYAELKKLQNQVNEIQKGVLTLIK